MSYINNDGLFKGRGTLSDLYTNTFYMVSKTTLSTEALCHRAIMIPALQQRAHFPWNGTRLTVIGYVFQEFK